MLPDQVASTLYFSGKCNLSCTYCFHPKLPTRMREVQEEVREWISSGKMADDLWRVNGDQLEVIALWGGEPLFNLDLLAAQIPDLLSRFPKLNKISFSTNLSTTDLLEILKKFLLDMRDINKKYGRHIQIDVQASLDGPVEINNCNRSGSDALKIVSNITDLLTFFCAEKFNTKDIQVTGKSTHTSADIYRFEDVEELIKYYKFYDDIYEDWGKITKAHPQMHEITYAYPGQYTKEDGLAFVRFLKVLYESEKLHSSVKNITDFKEQMGSKWLAAIKAIDRKRHKANLHEFLGNAVCSAVHSDFGLGYNDTAHVCQGTFFFDENVMSDIEKGNLETEFEKTQGYSFHNYRNFIKDKWIVNLDNPLQVSRRMFDFNMYTTSLPFRNYCNQTHIRQLAMAGLVDRKYMEEGHDLDIFTLLMTVGGYSCVANNLWTYGMVWVDSPSVMRLIGNGAIDYIFRQMIKRGIIQ